MKRRVGLSRIGLTAAFTLGGCAPAAPVFGAYVPAWLLCALIGILAAILARIGFVATGLSDRIPAQLWVCAAIGVIVASLCRFLWAG